jgi:hypothetical protein
LTASLFNIKGTLLAFGFGEAAKLFHAGDIAFAGSAGTGTQHREEVGAARGEHASAELAHALKTFVLHVAGHALTQHVENRKLLLLRLCRHMLGAKIGLHLAQGVKHFRRLAV